MEIVCMDSRRQLLNWKPEFVKRIMHRSDKEELEKEFEAGVKGLSSRELGTADEYLALWKQGKTDGERFYFGQKIVELILRKKA
jgi:hypothetical protein